MTIFPEASAVGSVVAEVVAEVVVEPMRWWDIAQVAELELVLFPTDSPWLPATFWSELAAGHRYRVCRGLGGAVAGYAGLAVGVDAADVQTVGVSPHARHQGIGRALLRDLLSSAADLPVLLEVRCDNDAAIALYESEGFSRIGVRRHYYQPSGADAYTMRRSAAASAQKQGGASQCAPGEEDI